MAYSFTMPAKNVTITAEFEKVPETKYSVTIGSLTNGTVTADKQTASEGEKVTLTVTPASGYVIETVKINGNAITAVGGVYSFLRCPRRTRRLPPPSARRAAKATRLP